jgi:hypothetical protein
MAGNDIAANAVLGPPWPSDPPDVALALPTIELPTIDMDQHHFGSAPSSNRVAMSPKRSGVRGRTSMRLVRRLSDDGRTESRLDEGAHLARPRVTVQGGLREQQLAVERYLEPAATAWCQRRARDPRRPRIEQLSHQTGGSIRVVSDDAELDLELVRSVRWLGLHDPYLTPRGSPARTRRPAV